MVKSINKNNKGSALYYVMIMLIVVTLILSATLYASYKNALLTDNYSSNEDDYNKCDSALEALRGQLAVRLVGNGNNLYKSREALVGNDLTDLRNFVFKNTDDIYLTLSEDADYQGFYVYRIEECRDVIICDGDGFKLSD